jgi:uncharacterized protein YrrD
MKKSQQIIGLPIISIAEGNEEGKVKDIVINAGTGTVDYFVVDGGIQALSTRVIPSGDVLGVGEYALTIPNPEVISDINKFPAAIDLLQKNITVKGVGVLTKKGSLIGKTGDFYVDTDKEFSITGIEFITGSAQNDIRLIPRTSVITFGKTLLVVEDDVQDKLLDDPSALCEAAAAEQQEDSAELSSAISDAPEPAVVEEIDLDLAEVQAEEVKPTEPVQPVEPATVQQEPPRSSAAELFEARQRQYLRGRKATRNITDSQGNIIIQAGGEITDQVIDRAKACGKLIELVMNNEA